MIASVSTAVIIVIKNYLHSKGLEPIEQSSLHNGVISSATFVIGFLLSATISDYKESERIPPEFAANLEDMYTDAEAIHQSYPKFDLEGFRAQLQKISTKFDDKVRESKTGVSEQIHALSPYFAEMEKAGVPPNFIVKLKSQQIILLKNRKRINYIQKINIIPSATLLTRSIVFLVIGLLIFTNIEPYTGSLAITGIISYVLIYMMILVHVISTPFHEAGETRDDVSMFLVEEAREFLEDKKKK